MSSVSIPFVCCGGMGMGMGKYVYGYGMGMGVVCLVSTVCLWSFVSTMFSQCDISVVLAPGAQHRPHHVLTLSKGLMLLPCLPPQ